MQNTRGITPETYQRLQQRAQQEGCSTDELLNHMLAQKRPRPTSSDLPRQVLERTTDTIVIFDLDLRYVYVNPAMSRLTGIPMEEIIGKTDAELGMPPRQVESWGQAWRTVIETGQEQIIEFDFETTAGWLSFESRLTPIFDADENLQYLMAITRDVTQRKRAEQQARRSNNILQRIFDNSHFMLAYMDADFNFIQVNERYAQADNKTPDDFIGKNHFELYPNAENEAIFRQVVAAGEPFTIYSEPFVYPLNPERGTTYWDWSLVPVQDDSGNVEGLVFTLIEVTQRVRAEQNLIESERFVTSVLRAIPNFIFIYDIIENRNVFSNAGVQNILGLTSSELLAMGFDALPELVHPDDMPAMHDSINQIANAPDNSDYYKIVARLKHRDGRWRWVEIQSVIFKRTEDNAVQQIVGSAIDITEIKQSEERLRVMDSAIASSITPIALADLAGNLTYVNEAFLKLWKLEDESQVLGRSVLEFWASEEAAQEVIKKIAEQDHYVGELTARISDDITADIALTATMVRDDDGVPICMMGSFNDVTKHKEAKAFALENERLKARFQKEQERNTLIQRIVSALSHDLRTHLTIISTSRDILSRYYDKLDSHKRQEKLDTIGRQIQLGLELLDDTVNMARGNLNDVPFRPAPINLSALCQVSANEVQSAHNGNKAVQFVNLSTVDTVFVDEVLVSRILLNLLSNAIKYSPDESAIRLELQERDSWVILRVVDEGIGIREDDLPYVFDPFYRSSVVKQINGTGLGLSIVKDCVDRHRGRVYVESEEGVGSTFTVELPIIKDITAETLMSPPTETSR